MVDREPEFKAHRVISLIGMQCLCCPEQTINRLNDNRLARVRRHSKFNYDPNKVILKDTLRQAFVHVSNNMPHLRFHYISSTLFGYTLKYDMYTVKRKRRLFHVCLLFQCHKVFSPTWLTESLTITQLSPRDHAVAIQVYTILPRFRLRAGPSVYLIEFDFEAVKVKSLMYSTICGSRSPTTQEFTNLFNVN